MLEVAVSKRLGSFALDVRFALPSAGVVALFGPSGCGKSTVINLIAGLLGADAGRIVLDGSVLLDSQAAIAVAAERRRIGYVFQDSRLFPHLSVAANLHYALARAVGPHFVSLEEVVRLLDLEALMPRRTRQLSGGERQRVAIGRALLSQPRLLLLDEPLASLDRQRREEVLPYLESLRDRLAIPMVYVSHRFEEILRLATHIVLMSAGSVTAQGSMAQISLDRRLRALIGPDAVGAIIDGQIVGPETASGLTRVRVGGGELKIPGAAPPPGTALRLQLLARDVIVSTQPPRDLSVRNSLAGRVTSVCDEDANSDLIMIDIGGAEIMAQVTKAATRELALRAGLPVWALIKSVSLRSRVFPRPALT
jgi:molybdate transport system ATP-binding protein